MMIQQNNHPKKFWMKSLKLLIKITYIFEYLKHTNRNEIYNIQDNLQFIKDIFVYILKCTNNNQSEKYASEIS